MFCVPVVLRTIVRVITKRERGHRGCDQLRYYVYQLCWCSFQPRTIVRVCPDPEEDPATESQQPGELREEYPDHNPDPDPDVNPKPEAPIPMAPIPNNSSGNPGGSASSPHAVCAVGISGTLAILHCILWVMLNNVYIWCYVTHSALC